MSKALLILFGGRSMPNMLTIIHEKPALIVAIVSRDQQNKLPQLTDAITELFKDAEHMPELKTNYLVDAFTVHDTYKQCLQAVTDHQGFDWIFNITAATTIMSIGAYEAAKTLASEQKPIQCWYLDTLHTRVVSLLGAGRDEYLFHLNVDQYVTVYNCRLANGLLEDQRQEYQEHWLPFATYLVQHPHCIDLLKDAFVQIGKQKGKPKSGVPKTYILSPATTENMQLWELAYHVGLVDELQLQKESDTIAIKLSYTQANFLDGPWLEVYVWDAARTLQLFSDCRWNQKVVDPKRPDDKDCQNELDVTMMYKAKLLVAECKTGNAFDAETLYKLDSIANQLGGNFVGRMLVTSLPIPAKDREAEKQYEKLKDRAEVRDIRIVTREELANIGHIIKEIAMKSVRI